MSLQEIPTSSPTNACDAVRHRDVVAVEHSGRRALLVRRIRGQNRPATPDREKGASLTGAGLTATEHARRLRPPRRHERASASACRLARLAWNEGALDCGVFGAQAAEFVLATREPRAADEVVRTARSWSSTE